MVPQLVAPPTPGPGICTTCRTWTDLQGACWNCEEIRRILAFDAIAINVISLYCKPSSMREWLTKYKGRDNEDDPFEPSYASLIDALLGRFILEHGISLSDRLGGIDSVLVVPSSKSHRPPPHPLEAIVDGLRLDVPRVEVLAAGAEQIDWYKPSQEGYAVTTDLPPQRILIIDDVHTTGARSNSAAYALRRAGHEVAGVLVIGRRVNPDYRPEVAAFWDAQRNQTFEWSASPVVALA